MILPPNKTLVGWHGSNRGLNEYLRVGDRVDDAMHDYFLGLLYPVYYTRNHLQVGEPYSRVNGRPTYITFARTPAGYWVYCGHCHYRQVTEPHVAEVAP